MTIFLLLSGVDPAIAGLKEGEKCREKGFSLPGPRIQLVTKAVSTKIPSKLSTQKAKGFARTTYRRAAPSSDVFPMRVARKVTSPV